MGQCDCFRIVCDSTGITTLHLSYKAETRVYNG